MPRPNLHVLQAAEAICATLHYSDFTHLGDTDEGRTSWFTRGDVTAKTVRISIERAVLYPAVFVAVEFLNSSIVPPRVGRVVMQVDCVGSEEKVREACEKAATRCLEIYRDVLRGTGVASREAYLAGRLN